MIVLKKMRKIHEHFRKILMFAECDYFGCGGVAVAATPRARRACCLVAAPRAWACSSAVTERSGRRGHGEEQLVTERRGREVRRGAVEMSWEG